MATRKKQPTSKELRLMRFNDIITKNKKAFRAGKFLTKDAFVNLFRIDYDTGNGTYPEVHRANLKLVQYQTEINMLMRENGLYLRSEDYYEFFRIGNKDRVKTEVIRYSAEVDINRACTTRLENNLKTRVKAGTWGTYNRVPTSVIQQMSNYSETKRHIKTKYRVIQY
jgi:hypothetical protein